MAARRWIVAGMLVLGALARAARAEEPSASVAGSGMRAYVDPSSGRFVPEPVVPSAPEALPAPAPVLAEEPAPGGGSMVRMQGHYMSNLVATVNPDGSLHFDCVTGDAPVPTAR